MAKEFKLWLLAITLLLYSAPFKHQYFEKILEEKYLNHPCTCSCSMCLQSYTIWYSSKTTYYFGHAVWDEKTNHFYSHFLLSQLPWKVFQCWGVPSFIWITKLTVLLNYIYKLLWYKMYLKYHYSHWTSSINAK